MGSQEVLLMRILNITNDYATSRNVDKFSAIGMKVDGSSYSAAVTNSVFKFHNALLVGVETFLRFHIQIVLFYFGNLNWIELLEILASITTSVRFLIVKTIFNWECSYYKSSNHLIQKNKSLYFQKVLTLFFYILYWNEGINYQLQFYVQRNHLLECPLKVHKNYPN